ncbi:lipoyl amidotransferase LIPT1, mitochondrial [Lepisosteus oculatus]|uniref:lipoyl amidotransferase LIPT1, mitochondrial n=1 Tax=Lepisosteus oculatus TaxID=7918 RepID=UPI0035F514BB
MIMRTALRLRVLKTHTPSLFWRPHSTSTPLIEEGCGGLVLKSLSTDVYENLAVEDWIHDNVELQSRNVLFIWRNSPAVVIGRHQNPWQECNLRLLREKGIGLARRRSGGGTVYHDLGNVNLTFFTSRKGYDRARNLGIVTRALKALRPGLDVHATERYDILLNGRFKISGTAARLGRASAYHHCTLLCGTDTTVLAAVLKGACQGIKSNATPSVPSPVLNLTDIDPSLDCGAVTEAVAAEYAAHHGLEPRVAPVDPRDESSLPGIGGLTRALQAWEWVYGKTPRFSVGTSSEVCYKKSNAAVTLNMEVKDGAIVSCAIGTHRDWVPPAVCDQLASQLVGSRFCPSETAVLTAALLRTCPGDGELRDKWGVLCENVAAVMETHA